MLQFKEYKWITINANIIDKNTVVKNVVEVQYANINDKNPFVKIVVEVQYANIIDKNTLVKNV
jgi:hypothetical protein